MKLCVFKRDGSNEVITPKAYKRTLDSIQTTDDLLRFIHKKTSKGVYPKNHCLKGPYLINGSRYYISLYGLKDMPKKYKNADIWNIYPLNETINVVDVVVVFKYLGDKDGDDAKMLPANISDNISLEEVNQLIVKNIDVIDKDDTEDSEEEEDEDDNEVDEEDDDEDRDEDEQQEIICKKKKKKKIAVKEPKLETKGDNNLAIPDDLDIIVSTDNMLEYESYDYEAPFIPEKLITNL
tara:strand:- start:30299 stop:31009 length:711 start_codon:yes stop_codon:yes gene_type:complete